MASTSAAGKFILILAYRQFFLTSCFVVVRLAPPDVAYGLPVTRWRQPSDTFSSGGGGSSSDVYGTVATVALDLLDATLHVDETSAPLARLSVRLYFYIFVWASRLTACFVIHSFAGSTWTRGWRLH